ncbi:MAG: glycosyltransferase [Chloroflexota bacterium]
MKFLWIRPTIDRAFGGPVAAITHLTVTLRELGHPCELVTLDSRNAPGVTDFPGVVHALGPSWGKYRFNTRLIPWLYKNVDRFDAVIVSGIWQYPSFATWLASRKVSFPYFVFTHGMLDPWFRVAYPLKHIKKWLYWPWADYRALRDASAILFTSAAERQLASQSFWLYKANEVVVNYGIGSPPGNPDIQRQLFLDKFPGLREKRLVVFLSRIHPKKGCDLLIDAFAKLSNQDSRLHLVMAGPDPDGWQSKLMQRASQLGLDESITWTGMLDGDLKWGAFHAADVFILSSHAENFGVAVVEALACGLPVLITDKVNIWREIKEDDAGIVEIDTLAGTIRLMQKWMLLSPDERQKMRVNARKCFLNRYEIKKVAENFVDIVRATIENDPRHNQKTHA